MYTKTLNNKLIFVGDLKSVNLEIIAKSYKQLIEKNIKIILIGNMDETKEYFVKIKLLKKIINLIIIKKMSAENTENVTMNVNEQLAEVEAPAATPAAAAPAPVNLTLGVLSNAAKLIELAISRGAYRPNEITAVGRVYDEFAAGLNTLASQVQAAQPAAAEAETKTV